MNRLSREKNPYLLQHATNPVDWFTWSDVALELAEKRNVPIFISIGYASCHWCHVMERESFTSVKIAKFLNNNFLNIKIDREERPDIDAIYMRSAEVLGVQGGWPLSVFATPQGKPFFIGTYFPAIRRHSMPSFFEVISHCAELWDKKYNAILLHAQEVYAAAQNSFIPIDEKNRTREIQISEKHLKENFKLNTSPYFGEDRLFAEHHLRYFDKENGGFMFHSKVKFPHFLNLEHLLRIAERESRQDIAEIAIFSLKSMLSGGIYDHLEGGICRYSTDYGWKAPHFEKTLYDNAWLLALLVSCLRSSFVANIETEKYFLDKACEVFHFLDEKLTSSTGLFYVAIDSESNGEEGAHCTWTKQELKDVFQTLDQRYQQADASGEQAKTKVDSEMLFYACFKLHYCRELKGRFVLLLAESLATISSRYNMSQIDCAKRIAELKQALLDARNKRKQPLLDRKSLMSWNGAALNAIAGLALLLLDRKHPLAYRVAQRARVLCLAFKKNLAGTSDYFFRRVADNQKAHPAQLADYASYGVALCAVHELGIRYREFAVVLKSTTDSKREPLEEAKKISQLIEELFYDQEKGFFYETSRRQHGEKSNLFPFAEIYDDVEPCGNSLAAELFAKLSQYDDEDSYVKITNRLFQAFASPIAEMKLPYMQKVLHDCKRGYWRLLFSENKKKRNQKNTPNAWWVGVIAQKNPSERLLCLPIATDGKRQQRLKEFLKNGVSEKTKESLLLNRLFFDKDTVLLCHENRCLLPADNKQQLQARLDGINSL